MVFNIQIDLFLAHFERRMCRGVEEFGRRHGRCNGRVCSLMLSRVYRWILFQSQR